MNPNQNQAFRFSSKGPDHLIRNQIITSLTKELDSLILIPPAGHGSDRFANLDEDLW